MNFNMDGSRMEDPGKVLRDIGKKAEVNHISDVDQYSNMMAALIKLLIDKKVFTAEELNKQILFFINKEIDDQLTEKGGD